MYNKQHFAIVITHMGRHQDIIEMPWLESEYQIDESDWMVLSGDGWRAVADGDSTIWSALKRKLIVGFYFNQPQLVVVIGHPSGAGATSKGSRRRCAGSCSGFAHYCCPRA